ncbi:uncharacterized protein HRG_11418 [Hirsutella rhossiliensis]|uniref:Uncharacterized protein n=1 Tax=Hirsutella rhossiliensis TaxID=111463 RepID=A0A9P8SE36_9HYPO|nr:uncharacterized protein HRG_11418 [Hirsutella rhossiliensis]KAH0957636.1 hypothetical protein HRG_11418 [Hirsutella rhossiliensis]
MCERLFALQQPPKLHSEATTAAPKPERQDDSKNAIGNSGNTEGESNNASDGTIEEAMPQSEGLRLTSSRLPGEGVEIPTVAFQTIIFGIMRGLFKEIEGSFEGAHVFAKECSSTLSRQDLQVIARFQGQLGSPDTLGGDPPYPVAENMKIFVGMPSTNTAVLIARDGERICKFSQKQN